MIVAGIDPGRWGAVAIVDTAVARVVAVARLPLRELGPRLEIVDGPALEVVLREHRVQRIVVEAQHARGGHDGRGPPNSPRSAHTAGRLYGSLLAGLAETGLPLTLRAPAAWKRAAGLLGGPKAGAVGLAEREFGVSFAAALEAARLRRAELRIAAAEAALLAMTVTAK